MTSSKLRSMSWRSIWLIGLLLILVPHTSACGGSEDAEAATEKEEGDDEEELKVLVETVTLETSFFEEFLELNGVTEPITAANVAPEVGGRITSVDLEEGATIERGTRVLSIDTSVQRARIDSIEVNIDQLEREIDRTERLVARGLASKASLEQLQAQRNAARKNIREIRVGNRQATTEAPISGIVVSRDAEPGEFASPGMPVGRIVDISTIVVNVGVPEHQVGYVEENMPVAVTIEALNETFAGTVHRVGVEANQKNRTFPVEIHMSNRDNKVRAGMRASVTLLKERRENAIVIPRDAILQALDGSEVFVIEDGKAHSEEIKLGPGMGNFVVVTDGLTTGDQLVVRGQQNLVTGSGVSISTNEACCKKQVKAMHDEYNEGIVEPEPSAETTSDTDTSKPVDGAQAKAEAPAKSEK